MHLIGRRNFVAGLGLGAGATLLAPLCRRIIGEALGQTMVHRRFVFVTQGNAWNHEGDTKGATGTTNTGQKSLMFRAGFRSATDFDLPAFMTALEPYKKQVAIWYGLKSINQTDANHGPQRALLTAVDVVKTGGGISIDRLIGKELQARHKDIHSSTNVGPRCASYGGNDPRSPSMDGPNQMTDAYMSPVKAFQAYFGITGMATATMNEKSLLDGMRDDIARARRRLGTSKDVAKLDHAVTSLREFEVKLWALETDPRLQGPNRPVPPTLSALGMTKELVRGLADVSMQALGLGLTHVAHLSLHGSAAFDLDDWKPLAGADFNDYNNMHDGLFHTTTTAASDEMRKMHRFTAGEIAWMREKLATYSAGNGTVADETVFLWMVQGGLRHHGGSDAQLVFMIAGPNTRIKTPYWADYFTSTGSSQITGSKQMGQAFASLAQAADLQVNAFGAAQGALPSDVLKPS